MLASGSAWGELGASRWTAVSDTGTMERDYAVCRAPFPEIGVPVTGEAEVAGSQVRDKSFPVASFRIARLDYIGRSGF